MAPNDAVQQITLRPAVGMGQMMAIPYVVALGVCDALTSAGIAWPYDVVDAATGEPITGVRTQGGYDGEGMFVRVELTLGEMVAEDVLAAVESRVESWARGSSVAPLASILGPYADKLIDLGAEVDVLFPNGNVHAHGTFVGVDVWGRATVRPASGKDLEFAPEKYRIARSLA